MDLQLDDMFEWQTLLGYMDAPDGTGSVLELPELIHDEGGSASLGTGEALWPEDLQVRDQAMPVTPPAAKPKRARAAKATGGAPKKARPVEQASCAGEHIIRERLRRDDMTAKYTVLESLLPPAPKRERVVMVDAAVLFVKDLQQKRNELLERRAHLKLKVPPRQVQTPLRIDSSGGGTASCMKLQHCRAETECATDSPMSKAQQAAIPTKSVSAIVEDPSCGSAPHLLQVHVHFCDEEIVIEIVCQRPRQDFQSSLLDAVESFGLDITRCSISRVPRGFAQCSIYCTKSQAPNPSEIHTSATLIGALRNVLSNRC